MIEDLKLDKIAFRVRKTRRSDYHLDKATSRARLSNVTTEDISQAFGDLLDDGHTMKTLSDDESLPFQSFSEHDSIHSEQQGSDNEQADTTNPKNHEEPDQEPCHEEEEDTDTPRRKKSKTFDSGEKLALKDLTSNAQKRLLDMTMQKMQPPIGGDGTVLEFHGLGCQKTA